MSNGKLVMCLSTDNKMPANTNTRPLSDLSVVDVGSLLDRLDISEFKAILVRNKIDGKSLVRCSTVDEVKEMGIPITVKAKLLFEKIREFQVNGVPMEYVQSSTQVYSWTWSPIVSYDPLTITHVILIYSTSHLSICVYTLIG